MIHSQLPAHCWAADSEMADRFHAEALAFLIVSLPYALDSCMLLIHNILRQRPPLISDNNRTTKVKYLESGGKNNKMQLLTIVSTI